MTVQAYNAPPGDHAWCPLCEVPRETRLLEGIPYWAIFQPLAVYPEELEVFSGEIAGKFDAACAFPLLEQVEGPAALLRSVKSPLEPLDCPPRHLSRRGAEQMRRIGGSDGLRLRELAFEPVDISVPAARIRDAVARGVGKIPVAGMFLGDPAGKVAWRVVLAPLLWNLYWNSGILERMGFFGLSVLASYNIVSA